MFNRNAVQYLRNITLALMLTVVMFLTNLNYSSQALAADNYSAATDTYQETRNPNRVNTTTDELKKSKMDLPESEGKSIYDTVVDRVNKERDTSVKGTSNTKTKSEP